MQQRTETKLVFKGLSSMANSKAAEVILLTDVEERSQISFLCDTLTGNLFERRIDNTLPLSNGAPEALVKILKNYPDISLSMHIVDIRQGRYIVFLTDENIPYSVTINADDAILLSIFSDIPLYMDSRLFKMQSTPYKEGSTTIAIPINIMSDKMLQKALNDAVKVENYELASSIKTEQQRRSGNNK